MSLLHGRKRSVRVRGTEQVQGVVAIVDEEHASATRSNGETEKVPCTCGNKLRCGHLIAERCDFDEVTVVAIGGNDVAVGSQHQPKWTV